MCRAPLSPKQPAWSSSGKILLTAAVLLALFSLSTDKEYSASPTASRLTFSPVIAEFVVKQNKRQLTLQIQAV